MWAQVNFVLVVAKGKSCHGYIQLFADVYSPFIEVREVMGSWAIYVNKMF